MKRITNFSLAIGLPLTWPYVPSAFFDSFIAMQKPDFTYIRETSGSIDVMRNNIVKRAIKEQCTHLIMMDADMTYHPLTIKKLLSHRLPLVGAKIYRRYPPFDPLMFRGDINSFQLVEDYKDGDLVEVDATGAGCMLYDLSIFQKMPEPWFRFRPNPNQEIGGTVGEDIGFCNDLRKAGYKIYVDTSIPSGHLTILEVDEGTHKLYKAIMKQIKLGGK